MSHVANGPLNRLKWFFPLLIIFHKLGNKKNRVVVTFFDFNTKTILARPYIHVYSIALCMNMPKIEIYCIVKYRIETLHRGKCIV